MLSHFKDNPSVILLSSSYHGRARRWILMTNYEMIEFVALVCVLLNQRKILSFFNLCFGEDHKSNSSKLLCGDCNLTAVFQPKIVIISCKRLSADQTNRHFQNADLWYGALIHSHVHGLQRMTVVATLVLFMQVWHEQLWSTVLEDATRQLSITKQRKNKQKSLHNSWQRL